MAAVVAIDGDDDGVVVFVFAAVAFRVSLIVAAVAFPAQSMDRKSSLSVNSVPRTVFLLIWVSAVRTSKDNWHVVLVVHSDKTNDKRATTKKETVPLMWTMLICQHLVHLVQAVAAVLVDCS